MTATTAAEVKMATEDPLQVPCGVSARAFGTAISLLGVLWLSPDTLLVRLVSEGGATIWAIHFWRMLYFFSFTLVAYAVTRRGTRLDNAFQAAGRVGILAGVMWGGSSTCFTASLSQTKVANALVILSSTPLWTALLSWVVLKERIPLHTGLAIVLALAASL